MIKAPMRPGDQHLVVNATKDDQALKPCPAKLFDWTGNLLWQGEALAQGVHGPSYKTIGGDTVPGLYVVSYVVRSQPDEPATTWAAFGEWFCGLGAAPGHQDPQAQYGRAGIGIHGGGSILGIRYADRLLPLEKRTLCLAPRQKLVATHGCLRLHNADADWVGPRALGMLKKGQHFFVSVAQEPQ